MLIDMPLEELRTYTGTNPCPPDFGHENLPGAQDRVFAHLLEL